MATSLPATMRAARLTKFSQPYELQTVPVPQIGDNDLLIKVGAAGFCHTDYQVWEGVYESPLPITPSHEPVGTIVGVGEQASKRSWKIGQRVGMFNFRHACKTCAGCRLFNADIVVCEKKEMAGIAHDGGFAEYAVAGADTTTLLPDNLAFEQAAPLMCAGATVWSGIKSAELPHGAPAAVIGIGGLGQLAIQFLKALGHPTVALRPDAVVDYKNEDAVQQVVRFAEDQGGVAGVIVCTDDVSATERSLKLLRPRGVCVPLGLPPAGFHFSAFDMVFKELTVRGSLVANKKLVNEMMEVVDKHDIWSYVTTVGFEDVPRLPEMYMDKHLKGCLVLKM